VSAAALSIIARLQAAGATLECKDGGRVRFFAPVPLPATLLAEARSYREAIAAALTANTAPAANHTAPDTRPALVEHVATEALDGDETPEPAAEWQEQDCERVRSVSRAIADGYLRAALQRPPSWWRTEAHRPTPGATCSCCHGQRWWSRDGCGWCCCTCHPPDHLAVSAVTEVRT
jgi:hypothetical protein